MNRAATSIVGGLMGVALGIFFPGPMAAVFRPATVIFPAGSCPAGLYTITALARNSENGQGYTTTLKNVNLPEDSVEVRFPDLPLGTYLVSATSVSNKGERFDSSVLAMTSVGDLGGAGLGSFVRQRPPSAPAVGLARPRNAPPRETPREPRATLPAGVSPDRPAAAGAIVQRSAAEIAFERFLARVLVRIDGQIDIDSLGSPELLKKAGLDWRRVEAVDADADGTIDSITIELIDGDVWVFRIAR